MNLPAETKMRYRHPNEQQSLKKHIDTLINNDDVLSTNEQEEIIGYFSDSLRCTLQFTKVVACLHLLIAAVYVALLVSGSPLVFKVLSAKEKRDLESIWKSRNEAEHNNNKNGSMNNDNNGGGGVAPELSDEAVLAGINKLYQQQRAEQQEQVMTYMTYRTTLDTSPSLTPLSTFMMLFAAALLVLGGVACWRACRAFRLDKTELISGEARELGAGPRGPTPAAAAGATATTTNRGEGDSSGGVPSGVGPSTATAPRRKRRPRSMKDAVVDPIWRSHTAIQLVLVVCSLVPTIYWTRTLARSHKQLNQLYTLLNVPTSKLFFGITDDILELLLVVWQPLFHTGLFFMIRSLQDTRNKLLSLASIKYRYDKL